ncbi:protein kinase [Bacillus gobiensis]|uniref:serine/threonine protein kinase n=1 Tax=Bacillus gobiensis TaxID=1441095 RepID=UPI003D255B14
MRFLKTLTRWIYDRPLEEGTIVANTYQIKKLIGMGSYGIAYLSFDLPENRPCVIKQLRPSKALFKRERKRFATEVELMKRLRHPLMPRYLGDFHFKGHSFYAMTYIEGENLEELLFSKKERFNEKEALMLVRDIAEIVNYLHSQHIFHSDLRIPNIVVTKDQVYLIDFGLAIHQSNNAQTEDDLKLRQDDYYDLGDLLLFLLYSDYTQKSKKALPWTEELVLRVETKMLLKRLLGIEEQFVNGQQVQQAIHRAIRQQK